MTQEKGQGAVAPWTIGGAIAGALAGGAVGAKIGLATGGIAIPATVPLGILVGTIGGLCGYIVGQDDDESPPMLPSPVTIGPKPGPLPSGEGKKLPEEVDGFCGLPLKGPLT